jgi:hypothetical protein
LEFRYTNNALALANDNILAFSLIHGPTRALRSTLLFRHPNTALALAKQQLLSLPY